MKMIFRILLFINLISCVFGTFVVNVTQTFYQSEENHNITLEWTFTTKPHTTSNSLYIKCLHISKEKISVLFHLHEGVEVSESQDQQFSGRVQFDKDVLREGRIRLHLSRLRTEDSGRYVCKVKSNNDFSSEECRLNVTEDSTEIPQPESRDRIGLYVGLGLTLGLVAVVTAFILIVYSSRKPVGYHGMHNATNLNPTPPIVAPPSNQGSHYVRARKGVKV